MSNITADGHGAHGRCNATDILVDCVIIPPLVNSIEGIWGYFVGIPKFSRASLQTLELQIMVVLATTHFVNMFIIKKIGNIPIFVSQLIAGLIIGSSVLGQVEAVHSFIFPNIDTMQIYDLLGSFGLVVYLFLVGVKTTPGYLMSYRKTPIVVGIGITIIPSFLGIFLTDSSTNDESLRIIRRKMIGPQLITALPVISQLLIDLKISNTKIGRLALATALAAHSIDLLSLMIFVAPNMMSPWVMAVGTIAFIVLNFMIVRPLLRWMIKRSPEGLHLKEWIVFVTMMFMFVFCVLMGKLGHTLTLGSFLFGLAVPEGPPLASALEQKFEPIITGIFLPLYVASVTMRLSPRGMFEDFTEVEFATKIIIIIFLVKVATCFAISLLVSRMRWKESLTFSLILCSRGIVEVTFYVHHYDAKANPEGSYAVGIISILLNSAILPIVIKILYNSIYMDNIGYENGNIMDLKQDSELKVLVCVRDEDEIGPLISILNSSGYSQESLVAVSVLQLKELKGSSTPFFIAHEGCEKNLIGGSYEDMILAFYQLEQQSLGCVVVNAFTSISPPDTMHMDICTLSCEQKTTLIILPFHRKWSSGGGGTLVDSESGVVRNMNLGVIDNAFCSIGILVHRRSSFGIGNQSLAKLLSVASFNVGMLFFGGNDDREALALVQRMARDPKVCLTVFHFVVKDNNDDYDRNNRINEPIMNWDMILDTEQMKAIKKNVGGGNVHYNEEVVKDGPETAKRIHNLVNYHDLIVVGRRYGLECPQTSSLSGWTEFSELGIIGDFLASNDIRCNASVLIVQQQNDVKVGCEVEHVQQGKPGKLKSINMRN